MYLLLLAAAFAADPCPAAPVDAARAAAALALVRGANDEVAAILTRTEAGYTCLARDTRLQDLVALYQLAGVAAQRAGRPDAARAAFRRALTLGLDEPLNPRFADEARALYEAERDLLQGQKLVPVRADGPIVLDGRLVAAGGVEHVVPGPHLVAAVDADGRVGARIVEIGADGVTLGSAAASSSRALPTTPAALPRERMGWLVAGGAVAAAGVYIAADATLDYFAIDNYDDQLCRADETALADEACLEQYEAERAERTIERTAAWIAGGALLLGGGALAVGQIVVQPRATSLTVSWRVPL